MPAAARTRCPLGAAALAGTAAADRPSCNGRGAGLRRGRCANSLDAVSDRDFVARSRWPRRPSRRCTCRGSAEEIVIWCSRAVRLHRAVGQPSPPAPRSCRRSAIPMRPSWCAPRSGASSARSRALHRGDEGPAADLCARTCRRTRSRSSTPSTNLELCDCGDDRDGRAISGPIVERLQDRRRRRLCDGDRSCRLAGVASSACRSARHIT